MIGVERLVVLGPSLVNVYCRFEIEYNNFEKYLLLTFGEL